MCGLIGIYAGSRHVKTSRDTVIKMRDSITHRGPDDAGVWQSPENNCILAHRRLAIMDLSKNAAQPMVNNAGTISIVFNGEIYNHAEIRNQLNQTAQIQWATNHSDTEVILRAYEVWGLDAIKKLQGMFAIAIFDRRNTENPCLHLIRDRVGVKPLYVTKTSGDQWIFGSEIKALLSHPDVERSLSMTALSHYLTFIVTPAPMTMFKNIWKIPAGFGITIDKNSKASSWQWWDCKPSARETYNENELSFSEAKDHLHTLLRQSIQKRMVSDVPFGVLLSGGVDSSLNVALMSELMDRPVSTFSVGYENHDSLNEFEYANKISKRYKTYHHELKINEADALKFIPELIHLQDEPIADNVCIPLYFLAQMVKQSGTTVVQVGEGADENFLGYWWCQDYLQKQLQPQNSKIKTSKEWAKNLLRRSLGRSTVMDDEILQRVRNGQELFWGGATCWHGSMRDKLTPNRSVFAEDIHCPIEGLLPQKFQELDSHHVVDHYIEQLEDLCEPDVYQKMPYLEMKNRLPEHLLMRVDKMTMAHSVEARVPFLDHDVVEFAMKLPLKYKINDGIGKYILKKVAEPYMDADAIYRKKQGFGAPMESWFKNTNFSKFAYHAIERSQLVKDGFLDKGYLKNLMEKQCSTGGGYSFHLWTVLNVVLWHDYWIEDKVDWLL